MRLTTVLSFVLLVQTLHALSEDEAITVPGNSTNFLLVPRRGDNKIGRHCDFSQGRYVSWTDTSEAIKAWCSGHAGQTLKKGTSKSDTVLKTGGFYMSDKVKVKLYVKYRNDHAGCWGIEEEACNWYLSYIAQGCTKGGNKPESVKNQKTDGGTYYEPLIGSVDMQWQQLEKSEI